MYTVGRVDRVSGETGVTVCVAVRGIQRGGMMWRQREECDREGRVSGEMSVTV
jgi:type IV secretory pathway protease TraF